MSYFSRITTKDVIAVTVVLGCIAFNGISLITGRPVDAATIGLAGAVVGHYFNTPSGDADTSDDAPLAPPLVNGGGE